MRLPEGLVALAFVIMVWLAVRLIVPELVP
jgi:hypothetical protein